MRSDRVEGVRLRRGKIYVWWYRCIGAAFSLLALRSLVRGDAVWSIVIRILIGVGFFLLARDARRKLG